MSRWAGQYPEKQLQKDRMIGKQFSSAPRGFGIGGSLQELGAKPPRKNIERRHIIHI